MGAEFTMIRELAIISATATEFESVHKIIIDEINSDNFCDKYASLVKDITASYSLLCSTLNPLICLNTKKSFDLSFSIEFKLYKERFQQALYQIRENAELTYEKYLQFRKLRETKTSYPSLKVAFSRLHNFIDKWIDNDIWLAMSIDNLFKLLNRHLTELQTQISKDPEIAYNLYKSSIEGFNVYTAQIESRIVMIESWSNSRLNKYVNPI